MWKPKIRCFSYYFTNNLYYVHSRSVFYQIVTFFLREMFVYVWYRLPMTTMFLSPLSDSDIYGSQLIVLGHERFWTFRRPIANSRMQFTFITLTSIVFSTCSSIFPIAITRPTSASYILGSNMFTCSHSLFPV